MFRARFNGKRVILDYLQGEQKIVMWHDCKVWADGQSEGPRKQFVAKGYSARGMHYVSEIARLIGDAPTWQDCRGHLEFWCLGHGIDIYELVNLDSDAPAPGEIFDTPAEPNEPAGPTVEPEPTAEPDEPELDDKTLAALDILCPGLSKSIERLVDRRAAAIAEQFKRNQEPRRVVHEIRINDIKKGELKDTILDPQFDEICQFVNAGIPVYLYGPAGTGKSTIAEQVAKALGLDFYTSNSLREEYKLTGYMDALSNYVKSQFGQAFENGGLFLLDELDASIPEVLILINNALAAGCIELPGKGIIRRHENFRIIGTGNTQGTGPDVMYTTRQRLDAATMNRFIFVEILYNPEIERSIYDDDNALNFVRRMREAAEKCDIYDCIISYRDIGYIRTITEQLRLTERRAVEVVITNKLTKDQRARLAENITPMPLNPYYIALKAIAA